MRRDTKASNQSFVERWQDGQKAAAIAKAIMELEENILRENKMGHSSLLQDGKDERLKLQSEEDDEYIVIKSSEEEDEEGKNRVATELIKHQRLDIILRICKEFKSPYTDQDIEGQAGKINESLNKFLYDDSYKFFESKKDNISSNDRAAFTRRLAIGVLIAIAVDIIVGSMLGLISYNVISPRFFTNYFAETLGIGVGAFVLSLIIGLLVALDYNKYCAQYKEDYRNVDAKALCNILCEDIFEISEENERAKKVIETEVKKQDDITGMKDLNTAEVATDNDQTELDDQNLEYAIVDKEVKKPKKIQISKDELEKFKSDLLKKCEELQNIDKSMTRDGYLIIQ